jgi:hypothetical protein
MGHWCRRLQRGSEPLQGGLRDLDKAEVINDLKTVEPSEGVDILSNFQNIYLYNKVLSLLVLYMHVLGHLTWGRKVNTLLIDTKLSSIAPKYDCPFSLVRCGSSGTHEHMHDENGIMIIEWMHTARLLGTWSD